MAKGGKYMAKGGKFMAKMEVVNLWLKEVV